MCSHGDANQALHVVRKSYGYTQESRFRHLDIYHEEVEETDACSLWAPPIKCNTKTLTYMMTGDQNAGKSTLLHALSHSEAPAFLRVHSYFPSLSTSFVNARLVPPGVVPCDEGPFLDTDVARARAQITVDAFLFFCDEAGLSCDPGYWGITEDTRYVSLQLIELGGDHLDRLMHRSLQALHRDKLDSLPTQASTSASANAPLTADSTPGSTTLSSSSVIGSSPSTSTVTSDATASFTASLTASLTPHHEFPYPYWTLFPHLHAPHAHRPLANTISTSTAESLAQSCSLFDDPSLHLAEMLTRSAALQRYAGHMVYFANLETLLQRDDENQVKCDHASSLSSNPSPLCRIAPRALAQLLARVDYLSQTHDDNDVDNNNVDDNTYSNQEENPSPNESYEYDGAQPNRESSPTGTRTRSRNTMNYSHICRTKRSIGLFLSRPPLYMQPPEDLSLAEMAQQLDARQVLHDSRMHVDAAAADVPPTNSLGYDAEMDQSTRDYIGSMEGLQLHQFVFQKHVRQLSAVTNRSVSELSRVFAKRDTRASRLLSRLTRKLSLLLLSGASHASDSVADDSVADDSVADDSVADDEDDDNNEEENNHRDTVVDPEITAPPRTWALVDVAETIQQLLDATLETESLETCTDNTCEYTELKDGSVSLFPPHVNCVMREIFQKLRHVSCDQCEDVDIADASDATLSSNYRLLPELADACIDAIQDRMIKAPMTAEPRASEASSRALSPPSRQLRLLLPLDECIEWLVQILLTLLQCPSSLCENTQVHLRSRPQQGAVGSCPECAFMISACYLQLLKPVKSSHHRQIDTTYQRNPLLDIHDHRTHDHNVHDHDTHDYCSHDDTHDVSCRQLTHNNQDLASLPLTLSPGDNLNQNVERHADANALSHRTTTAHAHAQHRLASIPLTLSSRALLSALISLLHAPPVAPAVDQSTDIRARSVDMANAVASDIIGCCMEHGGQVTVGDGEDGRQDERDALSSAEGEAGKSGVRLEDVQMYINRLDFLDYLEEHPREHASDLEKLGRYAEIAWELYNSGHVILHAHENKAFLRVILKIDGKCFYWSPFNSTLKQHYSELVSERVQDTHVSHELSCEACAASSTNGELDTSSQLISALQQKHVLMEQIPDVAVMYASVCSELFDLTATICTTSSVVAVDASKSERRDEGSKDDKRSRSDAIPTLQACASLSSLLSLMDARREDSKLLVLGVLSGCGLASCTDDSGGKAVSDRMSDSVAPLEMTSQSDIEVALNSARVLSRYITHRLGFSQDDKNTSQLILTSVILLLTNDSWVSSLRLLFKEPLLRLPSTPAIYNLLFSLATEGLDDSYWMHTSLHALLADNVDNVDTSGSPWIEVLEHQVQDILDRGELEQSVQEDIYVDHENDKVTARNETTMMADDPARRHAMWLQDTLPLLGLHHRSPASSRGSESLTSSTCSIPSGIGSSAATWAVGVSHAMLLPSIVYGSRRHIEQSCSVTRTSLQTPADHRIDADLVSSVIHEARHAQRSVLSRVWAGCERDIYAKLDTIARSCVNSGDDVPLNPGNDRIESAVADRDVLESGELSYVQRVVENVTLRLEDLVAFKKAIISASRVINGKDKLSAETHSLQTETSTCLDAFPPVLLTFTPSWTREQRESLTSALARAGWREISAAGDECGKSRSRADVVLEFYQGL